VRFEDRSSSEYPEAVIHAHEHFFFHCKFSDLLAIDASEIDFVDRSEHSQQLLQRLSQPVKDTQYFLPLGSAPAD
jgi:deoxyadenosine/deoxycytidine kinase